MSAPDSGLVTQFATLRQAPHLTTQQFRAYWSDVHGPAVCQLPGIYEYVQHHFAHDQGNWWPHIPEVERDLRPSAQLDGAPEVIFTSLAAREEWLTLAEGVKDDEINVFRSMTHQLVRPGNVSVFRETVDVLDQDHPLRTCKLLVFLRPRRDSSDLANWLLDTLPALADSASVRKLRLSILDRPEMSAWQPEGVAVETAQGDDFSACIELEWPDYLAARNFYRCDSFASFAREAAEHVSALNAFRCAASYQFVSHGRLTLAGRFGATTARLIREVGAVNRLEQALA